MGNCQSRLCWATTGSFNDDINIDSCRSEKSKKVRSSSGTLSPCYTQEQLDEVQKLYRSIDLLEIFFREDEIREKVRQIVTNSDREAPSPDKRTKKKKNRKRDSDREAPSPDARTKKKKNRKRVKRKKKLKNDSNQQHHFSEKVAEESANNTQETDHGKEDGGKGKRSLLCPSSWKGFYNRIMKRREQEACGKMTKDDADASALGERPTASSPVGNTSSCESEIASSSDYDSDRPMTVQERLARCHRLRKRMRKRAKAIEEASLRVMALGQRSPSISGDAYEDETGAREMRPTFNTNDDQVDTASIDRELAEIREHIRIASESIHANDNHRLTLQRQLESSRAAQAEIRSTGSTTPPTADEQDQDEYFRSDEHHSQESLFGPPTQNNRPPPRVRRRRNNSVEGLVSCSSSEDEEQDGRDGHGQARNSTPLSRAGQRGRERRVPNAFRNAFQGMRYATGSYHATGTPGFFPSISPLMAGNAFQNFQRGASGSRGTNMAAQRSFSANNAPRGAAFQNFQRLNSGTQSIATPEDLSINNAPRGNMFQELLRAVRRSRGVVTPVPFPPSNAPGGSFKEKGPKAAAVNVTTITVQPCEVNRHRFNLHQHSAPRMEEQPLSNSIAHNSSSSAGVSADHMAASIDVSSHASITSFDARPADPGGT